MGLHPHNTAQLHRTATLRGCTKSWKPNPWGLGPESCPGSLGWHCWEQVPRSQGVRVPTRAKRGCKGAGMACDLIAALSLSSLDPGRKRGHVAVIVLGKQTNLRRDREQLLGYRCYQGNGCGLPARSSALLEQGPARGWRGQTGKESKLGLPGETEGALVVAFAEKLFACQSETWSGRSGVGVGKARFSPGRSLITVCLVSPLCSLYSLAAGLQSFLLMCPLQGLLSTSGTPKAAADCSLPIPGLGLPSLATPLPSAAQSGDSRKGAGARPQECAGEMEEVPGDACGDQAAAGGAFLCNISPNLQGRGNTQWAGWF